MAPKTQDKRLIIVDISSFIFRAFFAIRLLHAPDGTPVNAVHGVLNMLLKLFSKYNPTHIFVAEDSGRKTFRNEIYPDYKNNRPEPPKELIPQFDLIKKLLEEMELPHLSRDNYEADDIVGSAVSRWRNDFDEILIASSDKDLMQLVGGKVKMVDTMKDVVYDEAKVVEKMGVHPKQIIDYLAIVGDSSDNVPGMRGIGPKGAVQLLTEHGSLEKCIEQKETFKGKKLTTAFSKHLEDALLSQSLVRIVTNIDLAIQPEYLRYRLRPREELLTFLKDLGFKSSLKKLEEIGEGHTSSISVAQPVHKSVEGPKDFDLIIKKLTKAKEVALELFFNDDDPYKSEIDTVGLSLDGKTGHQLSFGTGKLDKNHLEKLLATTYGRKGIEVCSSDIKRDIRYFLRTGRPILARHFDILQAHYVVNPSGQHQLTAMCRQHLDFDLEGPQAKTSRQACAVYLLAKQLKEKMAEEHLESVYYEIDNLLAPVLAQMEMNGITINKEFFFELGEELDKKILAIEKKIASQYDGEEINLNSPKQVSELLFEKLKLPIIKKTKTGLSTDVEVLKILAAKNVHPVPKLMLQHRELGKLLSTYVRPLPDLVNPVSGKIHTRFNQHIAATGRLSSTGPNLQNIPVRTEMGRNIRKGFVAGPGLILLGADYSQVELRLLAHFSEDPMMLDAFKNDRDIHQQTAAEVLGVPLDKVGREERAKAKAVNFGLMYGQSSFGLAAQLNISRKEAKEYITKYFERFCQVRHYLDSLKEACEKNGYAITMMKRKRFLPDIRSTNRTTKSMAERIAINSPIQGTAADIIKLAMIAIDQKLREQKLETRILLQVHDELIFEVPEKELRHVQRLVADSMENVVSLNVPLKVDMGTGVRWYDLK